MLHSIGAGSLDEVEPRVGRSVLIDHACELLGKSKRTVYYWIRDGRLRTIRTPGGSQRILLDSIRDLADGCRHQALPVAPSTSFRAIPHSLAPAGGVMSRRISLFKPLLLIVCALALAAGSVFAQEPAHRARLSRDLQEHLVVGSASVNVIVRGDRARLEELAARYGAEARGWLATGGVFRMNAAQLKALSEDPAVDRLSGDVAVHSNMAVTNAAIGADLLQQGIGARGPLTGRGVTIAVVDSGIAALPALRERIVATVDFTARGGKGTDELRARDPRGRHPGRRRPATSRW